MLFRSRPGSGADPVPYGLTEFARANLIVVVDQGELSQIGTHNGLLRSCLPYNQLWTQQTRGYQ